MRKLGEGASSVVWLAEQSNSLVAVKIGRSTGFARRLAAEAERLLLVDSSRVVRVVHAGFVDPVGTGADGFSGMPAVVLEWLQGDVPTRVGEFATNDRYKLALRVARDIGLALTHLHALGSGHGDIKPDNVIVSTGPEGFTATLIDLGLSSSADSAHPSGGTPRYLAPEALETAEGSDGRGRDLWALGLTLAEIAHPSLLGVDKPAERARAAKYPSALGAIVRALLATNPGARPSARWVHRRALGTDSNPALNHHEGAERRAYLGLRKSEIETAAAARQVIVNVSGTPGAWLSDAIQRKKAISELRGLNSTNATCEIEDLGGHGRRRWLLRLVGSAAADWPLAGFDSDDKLCSALERALETVEPEALTLQALDQPRPKAKKQSDPVELALLIQDPAANASVLDEAERWVQAGRANEVFTLALSRVFRLRGDAARALALLSDVESFDARLEVAELRRRIGDHEGAAGTLQLTDGALTPEQRGRRAATLARIELHFGRLDEAEAALASQIEIAATAEARALVAHARGDFPAARRAAERARALSTSEEERARSRAVAGVIAHSTGDSQLSLSHYSQAAEHAARAGATLEEAHYLTGAAAAAVDVGELTIALARAERAQLLFELLGRQSEAARAGLARAAVFASVGATDEALDAAKLALRLARDSHDQTCRAYLHFAMGDALPPKHPDRREHAERARQLLKNPSTSDRLRIYARLHAEGIEVDTGALDPLSSRPEASPDARFDWWKSRALRAESGSDTERVLTELAALSSVRAAPAVCGPAYAAGAELAVVAQDGEKARRFTTLASRALRELISKAPPELERRINHLSWVKSLRSPREQLIAPDQLSDIETLVRALSTRDRLRPLLDQILDALVLWTGVERGLLLLRTPTGGLAARAARNLARSDLSGEQKELSYSLAERALLKGEPVVAVDATGDLPEVHKSVHQLKLRSVLAVPLMARGEALGVVYLDDRVKKGAFGPKELAWVQLVATLASVAIVDARAQLLLRRAARRARRAEARLESELAQREAELDLAARELALARGRRATRHAYDTLIGQSSALFDMLKVVDRVVQADVPVIIVGESGSGKELVARAIHDHGKRREQAFVTENCGAIPETLLESTLFGHVRGAFTGAVRTRAGLFEVANRGSLFLDEIAEMSLGMQTKLLRVLQEGEVRPVGSERARPIDVRVIAATHRDIRALVKAGRFREDLYYRLNVITVKVPPLRERSSDIALLAQHFLEQYGATQQGRPQRFSKAALDVLSSFHWPGNVRQLQNEVRRAIVLADGVIEPVHLSDEVRAGAEGSPGAGLNLKRHVDALESRLVREALSQTQGNQTRAAELLGLSRFGLQKMIKRLRIEPTDRGLAQATAELGDVS